jgi:hypothetical protein
MVGCLAGHIFVLIFGIRPILFTPELSHHYPQDQNQQSVSDELKTVSQ